MIEQILRAVTVRDRPNIYFLGPYAKRLSFAAQQYRALNLVWALKTRGLVNQGDAVAVVGAGLSGMTAAKALAAMGCKVEIFERHSQPMWGQRQTQHRVIHPTINRWPLAEVNPTSELPFLDWYAGQCSDVVEAFDAEWSELLDRGILFRNWEVTNVSSFLNTANITAKPSPSAILEAGVKDPQLRGYAAAIVAVGFADERDTPGNTGSYWAPDGLEAEVHRYEKFLVSGCGDGGLIDALRIIHRKFDRGWLAIELAEDLDAIKKPDGVSESIRKEEWRAEREMLLADDEEEGKAPNQDKTQLLTCYQKAVQAILKDPDYSAVKNKLDQSMDARADLVVLADRKALNQYSTVAAPIHKLMIAHAEMMGRLKFQTGSIEPCPHQADWHVVGSSRFGPETKIIRRHGAAARFGDILNGDQIAFLKRRQAMLSDDHGIRLWTDDFDVPPGGPKAKATDPAYQETRRAKAIEVLRRYQDDPHPTTSKRGFELPEASPLKRPLPSTLFGVPLYSVPRASREGSLYV